MADIVSMAPSNNPLRKAFRSYFKGRWQNMQNIVSNLEFYANMPDKWKTYQQVYVRQWDEWTRGFVIAVHKADMFSVGMGYTVCDIMTRECIKGGFRFDGKDIALNSFVDKWGKANDFETIINEGFLNANRLGNTILRLNVVAGQGELYPTVHACNECYFQVDRRGKITKAKFLDRLETNTADNRNFLIVEERIFFNGKPYYRINVHKDDGTATSPQYSTNAISISKLDGNCKDKIKETYGDIIPNTWYTLPFKTLGCYNWKNKPVAVAVGSYKGLADSTVHTALDILYSIDYNWSNGQMDNYMGKSRALIPKEMRPMLVNGNRTSGYVVTGEDYASALSDKAPLEDDFYSQFPTSGSDKQQAAAPIFVQPDLRGEARKYIRDADLELLASKVGLSSSTLANHLAYNNSKTATEVNEESDTTDVTVGYKRNLAEKAINAMIADLLDYYSLGGVVDITWNQSGQNSGKHKDSIISEYSQGVMPLEECVKRLHPELTQEEVTKWVIKLQAEKIEKSNDLFGGGYGS